MKEDNTTQTFTRVVDPSIEQLQQELDKYKAKEKEIRKSCKKRPLDEYYLIPIISVGDILDILDSKE